MKKIHKYIIKSKLSIREVIKHMSDSDIEITVCVNDKNKVLGVFTEGDFRKAIFEGMQLDDPIKNFLNNDFTYVSKNFNDESVEKIFNETIIQQIPVIDDGFLIDVLNKKDFFLGKKNIKHESLNNSVVIMAGGKGTRMDPLSRILPKPLIPFGNEAVIKIIMDRFKEFGVNDFKISVNEKSKMIKAYFHDHSLPYDLEYIEEDKPLGTIGSLKLIENTIQTPFFISNCDIILKTNYSAVMNFHLEGKYDLTIIGAIHNLTIPYGVCEVEKKGQLKSLNEKPRYDYLVNTGVYVSNPEIIKYIPSNKYFDITDLIKELITLKKKIGVYPISENDWIDLGQWDKYQNAIEVYDKAEIDEYVQ